MQKQIQTFFTDIDERAFSQALVKEKPSIHFLDNNVWDDEPLTRSCLSECQRGVSYLYDGDLDELPTIRRKTGQLEGPAAGCVVQVLRSRIKDGVMTSGRVAVSFEDDDMKMKELSSIVWKCLKKLGSIGIVRPDGKIDKHYLVGNNAKNSVLSGDFTIADRAIGMPYQLP